MNDKVKFTVLAIPIEQYERLKEIANNIGTTPERYLLNDIMFKTLKPGESIDLGDGITFTPNVEWK